MTRKKTTSAAERYRERISETQELAEAEVLNEGEAAPQRSSAAYSEVPIVAVAQNLSNVRDNLGDLAELVESVRAVGVLQPLIVRPITVGERDEYPDGTRYIAVMGNRRRAAALEAGQSVVPVVVRDDITTENQRLRMLVENLQRQDLTPLEEARAFQSELDKGMSQRRLSQEIGVTQPHISRRLSLLRLDPMVQAMVAENRVGVDVVVNTLSRMEIDDQRSIAEEFSGQTVGLVDPDLVRRSAERLQRERAREQHLEGVRAKAVETGASRTISWNEALTEFGEEVYWPLTSKREIAAAAEAGELVAVVDTRDPDLEPRFLSSNPAKRTESRPDERHADAQAKERREWRKRQRAIEVWVREHQQPSSRAEFTSALQRFVVETMSTELGKIVHKWLKGTVGDAKADYYGWQASLTEADYPVIAWLVTVASDLGRTKHCGLESNDAGHRTKTRLQEAGQ